MRVLNSVIHRFCIKPQEYEIMNAEFILISFIKFTSVRKIKARFKNSAMVTYRNFTQILIPHVKLGIYSTHVYRRFRESNLKKLQHVICFGKTIYISIRATYQATPTCFVCGHDIQRGVVPRPYPGGGIHHHPVHRVRFQSHDSVLYHVRGRDAIISIDGVFYFP